MVRTSFGAFGWCGDETRIGFEPTRCTLLYPEGAVLGVAEIPRAARIGLSDGRFPGS